MRLKSGRLTGQQKTFAKRFGETQDATYAAAAAGYSFPTQAAHQNLHNETIIAEARKHARQRLMTEGAQVGVAVLVELALDNKQPGGVRRAAASDLVKHSGVGAAEGGEAKEPHEMTAEELSRAIDTLERVAADRAKPVGAPEPSVFD